VPLLRRHVTLSRLTMIWLLVLIKRRQIVSRVAVW
jgi:hypothetical protein